MQDSQRPEPDPLDNTKQKLVRVDQNKKQTNNESLAHRVFDELHNSDFIRHVGQTPLLVVPVPERWTQPQVSDSDTYLVSKA